MRTQFAWLVGGQQGDGFTSTGETFALGLNRLGYYIYGYFTNSSRILGGHANYRVRISSRPRPANADEIDMIVAFDEETVRIGGALLCEGGLILCDETMKVEPPARRNAEIVTVPMSEIAEQLGAKIVKNMVAVGASAAILGVDPHIFAELMEQRFARKGEKVVAANVQAIRRGYDYVRTKYKVRADFRLSPVPSAARLLMTGNDAVGLGAIAAGCRAMYAYPITPATDIMEYLADKLPRFGGVVLQTEDEIAAVNMAIGSAYGGVRAMTATSGPGLSLMMEAIGLAGMTEMPLVIVDTQRSGPSTGMPTKQEQSDLNAALYGTHGEIPKIVLAPSTAEECYYETIRAFHLAEAYQCPVIVLTDTALSQAPQTVGDLGAVPPAIDRGELIGFASACTGVGSDVSGEAAGFCAARAPAALHAALAADATGRTVGAGGPALPKPFKRYELTDSGISPRVAPGTPGGLHHVTGVEHDETGRPSEAGANRKAMMDKRQRKMQSAAIPDSMRANGPAECDILLIGWGSTRGAIEEALERLRHDGAVVSHIHVKALMPFPAEPMRPYIERARHVFVVENNSTGQLAALLLRHVACGEKLRTVLKYDGEPFYPREIAAHVKMYMES